MRGPLVGRRARFRGRAYAGGLDSMPDTTISVKVFEPTDLTLDDPAEGEPQLKHDQTWEMTSAGYDETRDAINAGIDFINGLGAPGVHLPRLPDGAEAEGDAGRRRLGGAAYGKGGAGVMDAGVPGKQ